MIGVQIGVYRVVRQIGEGGMGAVWLAEHVMLGRHVAIKVLHREASQRPELVQRFFNEAKAATAISDPGIIQIFDFGHHSDGNAYIVMELLDGEPLDHRLRRFGKLPLHAALRILRQDATTLAAAHRRGIIHRDIKPENIFLVRDPEVAGGERTKLLDFGIAKLSTDHRVKTHTAAVMGTPVFMSPEQCRGAGQVDHRSDLYSLGCVLFTLLTGRPPFDADGVGEVIAMHLREPPPAPSAFLPGLPEAVDELVLRCLSKDREKRYQTGTELAAAIEEIAEQLTAHDVPRRAVSEAEVLTEQSPPVGMTPVGVTPVGVTPVGVTPAVFMGAGSDVAGPRFTPGGTPLDTERMAAAQVAHPQAVPIVAVPTPLQPSALAHQAQAVVMTPLAAGRAPITEPSVSTSIPRAPTGEEPTAPFVTSPPSGMPARSSPRELSEAAAEPAPFEPYASGALRPSQVGQTTLSQSIASGPIQRKSGARVGLIASAVAVVAAGGIAAATLSSRTSSSRAGAGAVESAAVESAAVESAAVAAAPAMDAAAAEEAVAAAPALDAAAAEEAVAAAPALDAAVALVAPLADSPAAAPQPAAPESVAPAAGAALAGEASPPAKLIARAPVERAGAAERELTERHMRAVAAAFTKWAKDNQGKACPSFASLGMLLDPDDARDGWGAPFRLSCGAQAANQRIAILSAGPDGRHGSGDDVASWKTRSVAAALKGARWGAAAESPSRPKKAEGPKQPSNTTDMPTARRR